MKYFFNIGNLDNFFGISIKRTQEKQKTLMEKKKEPRQKKKTDPPKYARKRRLH